VPKKIGSMKKILMDSDTGKEKFTGKTLRKKGLKRGSPGNNAKRRHRGFQRKEGKTGSRSETPLNRLGRRKRLMKKYYERKSEQTATGKIQHLRTDVGKERDAAYLRGGKRKGAVIRTLQRSGKGGQ